MSRSCGRRERKRSHRRTKDEGIGTDERTAEDAARELIELLVLESFEGACPDLGRFGDLFQRYSAEFALTL